MFVFLCAVYAASCVFNNNKNEMLSDRFCNNSSCQARGLGFGLSAQSLDLVLHAMASADAMIRGVVFKAL